MRHITDSARSFTQDAMAAMAAMPGPSTGVQPEGTTGAEFSSPEMLSEIRCRNFFFQVAKYVKFL